MPTPNEEEIRLHALIGWQADIRCNGKSYTDDAWLDFEELYDAESLVGQILGPGDYYCLLPVGGADKVQIRIQNTNGAQPVTVTLAAQDSYFLTSGLVGNANGDFTASSTVALEISGLCGRRFASVWISVPPGASLETNLAVYNAK